MRKASCPSSPSLPSVVPAKVTVGFKPQLHPLPQLDANEAEPVFDEREGVDEYNEMPMPV